MDMHESILPLFENKDVKSYFIKTFNSFSSDKELRTALKKISRQSWGWLVGNNTSIGILDDIEIQFLFIILKIRDLVAHSEKWSRIHREIFHESIRNKEEEKDFKNDQRKRSDYRDQLHTTSKKASAQLVERIELRFNDAIPHFLEENNLLKKKTVWHKGCILTPGYGFDFGGDAIFVVNQYPMSGD
ncbi:MAG: hypothetical protein HGA67_02335 [Candidatus Yonathbacteria bacterium]|nr:hypothetical protein [Candidatus Yonathbacteria bacterium]